MFGSKLSALSALAALSLGAIAAQAKVVYHFNGNGSFADASGYGDGSGYAYSNISVSRGGTTQAQSTYLYYYSYSCDSSTWNCTGIQGYGQIPNKDFNASSKAASLSTNTGANANFWASKWTYDYSTGQYSESQINLGYINVDWKSSGLYTSKSVGTNTNTYLNTTLKSTGQSSYAAASVTGSVGGTPLNAVEGSLGTNSNNDIYIERN